MVEQRQGVKKTMIKYLKCTYRKVEWWLYNYQQHKAELESALEDLAYGRSPLSKEYIPNIGYVSNPTEHAYLEYEKKYGKMEKWCKVIEQAMNILKAEHQRKYMLLILKYFEGWSTSKICEELNITERDFYKWKDDIVSLVALLAVQERLIKVIAQ